MQERDSEDPPVQINSITSPPDTFGIPDADLIIQSSDLVNFWVHKPVLAIASPYFKGRLFLRQPPDGKSIDGVPLVQIPEDSDLMSVLVSMLYLHPVIPNSYDKVLSLLATRQ